MGIRCRRKVLVLDAHITLTNTGSSLKRNTRKNSPTPSILTGPCEKSRDQKENYISIVHVNLWIRLSFLLGRNPYLITNARACAAFKGGEAVILSIDLETYSGTPLEGTAVSRYSSDRDLGLLPFAEDWQYDPLRVFEIKQCVQRPPEVREALAATAVVKSAFNASFEGRAFGRYFWFLTSRNQWPCPM